MGHMPHDKGETSHQTALASKRKGIRHFPLKLCHQSNERRFHMFPSNFEKVPDQGEG